MIVTRLAGGLGNQMFHYAIARKFQRSDDEPIVLDTRMLRPLESDIEKIVQRPLALGIFRNLKATVIDDAFRELLDSMRFAPRLRRQVFKARTRRIRQVNLESVNVQRRRYEHLWLEGNFQSEEHFPGIRQTLLEDFSFPELDARNAAIEARIQRSANALSIHIRRGDYHSSSNKPIFDSVNLDYYKRALESIARHIPFAAIDAFIFSDDPLWAQKHFSPAGLRMEHIVGNNDEDSWKDMRLMSACRHHIIANSSFSWWGAWLAQRAGEKTAPRHWFRPNTYPYRIEHIVPTTWRIIDYELA